MFRLLIEFFAKALSSAMFGILLLIAFAVTAPMGESEYFGLYRYDYLLIYALLIQALLLYFKVETWQEAKVISLFHLLGVVMELFLTYQGSWQYPQPAVFKIAAVPLFAGFMYSSVGSFFCRCLKLYQIEFHQLPSCKLMISLAVISYLNFMTKFYIWDLRLFLFIFSFILFYRTKVKIQLRQYTINIPMLLILSLFAFLIWIAENISTFYKIWLYPTQVEAWHRVGFAKMGSWYLLLLLSLVLVMRILYRDDGKLKASSN